jgi:hypothetical protein
MLKNATESYRKLQNTTERHRKPQSLRSDLVKIVANGVSYFALLLDNGRLCP